MTKAVYNFSPGPSVLPEAVLRQASGEMLDYRGCGMSVLEMSHRSPIFGEIIATAESRLRELLAIPQNYRVLFLQGGASTQFAMVPLNLMRGSRKAVYLDTGIWSGKAIKEAGRFGEIVVAASSKAQGYNHIPAWEPAAEHQDADYIHITTNNTITGTRYDSLPRTGSIPLVADMSSGFLSERCDVTRFGLIYAGAQKNAGPAGLTIVIMRDNLVGHAGPATPSMLDYQTHAESGSLYNTPPTFAIYLAGLVFEWLQRRGGLAATETENRQKAAVLYELLDGSRFFSARVAEPFRSRVNIPFLLADPNLDQTFLDEAAQAGLVNLKGHRLVGGMRASLYNALPRKAVQALVDFMIGFEKTHAG